MSAKITGLVEHTDPDDADVIEVIDFTETVDTDARNKKITRSNWLKNVTIQEWVPASAMYPAISNPCQPIDQREIGANNVDTKFLEFLGGADSVAKYDWGTPKNWNAGTVKVKLQWTTEEGASGDDFQIEVSAVAEADSDAIGAVAFGTPVDVDDTKWGWRIVSINNKLVQHGREEVSNNQGKTVEYEDISEKFPKERLQDYVSRLRR